MNTDFLYTLSEVSVAFVGFSAIVAALRQRNAPLSEEESLYMGMMVERSLSTLAFCVMPPLFESLGVTGQELWTTCSALLGLYLITMAIRSIRVHLNRVTPTTPTTFWTRASVPLIVGVQQFLNAAGFGGEYAFGWYSVGLVVLLTGAGFVFVLLLQSTPETAMEKENKKPVNVLGKDMTERSK